MDTQEMTDMHLTTFDPDRRSDILCSDLTEVAIWLRERYPDKASMLVVDFHRDQKHRQEIAYVVILWPEPAERRAMRADATKALIALGWQILPGSGSGGVEDASPYPIKDMSAHARLRAVGRIEAALHSAGGMNSAG